MWFYDFIYYNFIGLSTFSIGFLTLEYLSSPDDFFKNIIEYTNSIKYWTIDKIVTLNMLYNTYLKHHISKEYSGVELFDIDNNYEKYYGNDINDKNLYINTSVEHNCKVYKETTYLDYTVVNGVKVSSPFMSCELLYKSKNDKYEKYDLTEILKPYYILGNIIDKNLICVILKYNLKVETHNLSSIQYRLNILNNSLELVEYNENDIIELTIDNYIVTSLQNIDCISNENVRSENEEITSETEEITSETEEITSETEEITSENEKEITSENENDFSDM